MGAVLGLEGFGLRAWGLQQAHEGQAQISTRKGGFGHSNPPK